jgi:Zn-dependent peptidase ImmA (M78 family)/transcriptional regulator with XRE-family HTH domain
MDEELGRCLQTARKRVRLSQTAVANQLGVTRQVVSAYESGKRGVSADELRLLCNLFRIYPNKLLGFDRSANRSKQVFVTASAFRMNTGIFALTDDDQREVEEMTRRVTPDAETYVGRWKAAFRKYAVTKTSPFWSTGELATSLRKGLQQDQPPINIYLMAERLGILVTPTFLDKAAAVVNRMDEQRKPLAPPWILVSSAQPVERQRYSIAHEIAHLFLHEEELIVHHPHYYRRHFDQREVDAESFAAQVLMPTELVQESVSDLKGKAPVEESVYLLSNVYQVSFTAMSKRLYELHLITRAVYNHLESVKPSKLQSANKVLSGKRPFREDRFIPTIIDELQIKHRLDAFDQDAVRRMQEMAYTRYLGSETQGGSKPGSLYSLESPAKVYEKVAIWIAQRYPMYASNLPA